MAVFALVCALIVLAVGAVLIALTALDEAKDVRKRQDATETRVSALGVQMQKLRREKAGYPPVTPIGHLAADPWHSFPPRPEPSPFLKDLQEALK